jgi:hypothetical protein
MSLLDPRQFVLFLFILFIVVLAPLSLSANPPDTAWTRAYGGPNVDVGAMVKSTPDGGYLIIGWSYSFGSGGSDLYLIRTDSVGNEQWARTYGGPSNDGGDACVMTSDTCYLIAGLTYSFGAGGSDVWIVKIDPAGDTLWTKVYGGQFDDVASAVQRTSDGNYIIAGRTYDPVLLNEIFLLKVDESGDTIWTRSFGTNGDEYCYSLKETNAHDFIMCGRREAFGAAEYDVFLAKSDSTGNLLWLKSYGGHQNDYGYSVQNAPNNGYLIAGHTRSFGAGNWDVYLIRTDSLGDTLWTRTYGGSQPDEAFCIERIQSGFVIAGASYSYGAGLSDMYVLRVSDLGDTLWTATYGGDDEDWAYDAMKTQDSAFAIVGYSESFGPGYVDVYLVKTEADVGIKDGKDRKQDTATGFTAFPNPFTTRVEISLVGEAENRRNGGSELKIYDVAGRRVRDLILYPSSFILETTWDGRDEQGKLVSPGIYFVSLDGSIQQKVVKIK